MGILKMEDPYRFDSQIQNKLNKGDVLLLARGRFVACHFDDDQRLPCVATSAFIVLTLLEGAPEKILSEYLTLFFNSPRGQNLLIRWSEQATIPFIGCDKLGAVEIPVPSLQEQQAMVDLWLMNRYYTRLTARKIDLLNNLVNSRLTATE